MNYPCFGQDSSNAIIRYPLPSGPGSPTLNEMGEDSQKVPTLVALEEKLTFQQRQLDALNEVVLEQQAELERQRRELSKLANVAQGLLDRTGEDLPHEKPPHY